MVGLHVLNFLSRGVHAMFRLGGGVGGGAGLCTLAGPTFIIFFYFAPTGCNKIKYQVSRFFV